MIIVRTRILLLLLVQTLLFIHSKLFEVSCYVRVNWHLPARNRYFHDKALEIRYSQHMRECTATSSGQQDSVYLWNFSFHPKPLNGSPGTQLSVLVHAEVGSGFNYASVVWNGFIHPLHVSRTAILYWEAEDFWVCIRVERPWRDKQTNVKYEISILLDEWAPQHFQIPTRQQKANLFVFYSRQHKVFDKRHKDRRRNVRQYTEARKELQCICSTVRNDWLDQMYFGITWKPVFNSDIPEILSRSVPDRDPRRGIRAGLHIQNFILALYFSVHYGTDSIIFSEWFNTQNASEWIWEAERAPAAVFWTSGATISSENL